MFGDAVVVVVEEWVVVGRFGGWLAAPASMVFGDVVLRGRLTLERDIIIFHSIRGKRRIATKMMVAENCVVDAKGGGDKRTKDRTSLPIPCQTLLPPTCDATTAAPVAPHLPLLNRPANSAALTPLHYITLCIPHTSYHHHWMPGGVEFPSAGYSWKDGKLAWTCLDWDTVHGHDNYFDFKRIS